jgi:V8-like Glu-specific endopeptidase
VSVLTGLAVAAAGLLPVLSAAPAYADELCRPGTGVSVALGYSLQPCVYQDSSGVIHAKVTSTGGVLPVRLFVEVGESTNGGPVQWLPSTLTDSATNAGDHAGYVATPRQTNIAYSSLVSPVHAVPNTVYFAKAYLTWFGFTYGDVEAGPLYTSGNPGGGTTWTTSGEPTVGKLYYHLGPVHWNCTGTVIGTDIVATAGHCIYNSTGNAFGGPPGIWLPAPTPDKFVPNDNSGGGHAAWSVQASYIPSHWYRQHAPDADFGLYVIKPRSDGAHIGDVVGIHKWTVSNGVNVPSIPTYTIGYPSDYNDPRACNAPATRFDGDNSQVKIDCTYADGGSGGPLSDSTGIAYANIGGFQQGGDNAYPSYGVVWNSDFLTMVINAEHGSGTAAAGPATTMRVTGTAAH